VLGDVKMYSTRFEMSEKGGNNETSYTKPLSTRPAGYIAHLRTGIVEVEYCLRLGHGDA
jgi:hypothetical protein